MRFNLTEVASLLHIHEKAMGHPKLKSIADAAMKHLESLAEDMVRPVEAEWSLVKPGEEDASGRDEEKESGDEVKEPKTVERRL